MRLLKKMVQLTPAALFLKNVHIVTKAINARAIIDDITIDL